MDAKTAAPCELVDASFIRDDDHTQKVGKLQEILYYLEEGNYTESLAKIVENGLTSDSYVADLARNIIRLSVPHKSKLPLFVRLVSDLRSRCEIVSHIEHLVEYGMEIGSQAFLLALIDAKLINSQEPKLKEQTMSHFFKDNYQEKTRDYQQLIGEDDVEELKLAFASLNFKINQQYLFRVPSLVNSTMRMDMTLVEFAALCSSIKCFRFLYINGANLIDETNQRSYLYKKRTIIHLAIIGGNEDIMKILEQEKIQPYPSCISSAIIFHRIEIFDWLVDQFPEQDFSIECLQNEFVHGINRIRSIDPQKAFDILCDCGLASLAKLLSSNFNLNVNTGFIKACYHGHVEVVKLLLSLPSTDVNMVEVFFLFKMFIQTIL